MYLCTCCRIMSSCFLAICSLFLFKKDSSSRIKAHCEEQLWFSFICHSSSNLSNFCSFRYRRVWRLQIFNNLQLLVFFLRLFITSSVNQQPLYKCRIAYLRYLDINVCQWISYWCFLHFAENLSLCTKEFSFPEKIIWCYVRTCHVNVTIQQIFRI